MVSLVERPFSVGSIRRAVTAAIKAPTALRVQHRPVVESAVQHKRQLLVPMHSIAFRESVVVRGMRVGYRLVLVAWLAVLAVQRDGFQESPARHREAQGLAQQRLATAAVAVAVIRPTATAVTAVTAVQQPEAREAREAITGAAVVAVAVQELQAQTPAVTVVLALAGIFLLKILEHWDESLGIS